MHACLYLYTQRLATTFSDDRHLQVYIFFSLIYGFSTKDKHNYFSNKLKKNNSDTFLKLILWMWKSLRAFFKKMNKIISVYIFLKWINLNTYKHINQNLMMCFFLKRRVCVLLKALYRIFLCTHIYRNITFQKQKTNFLISFKIYIIIFDTCSGFFYFLI